MENLIILRQLSHSSGGGGPLHVFVVHQKHVFSLTEANLFISGATLQTGSQLEKLRKV